MEARKFFMDPGASTSKTQKPIVPRREKFEESIATKNYEPTVLKLFLQTCMKLLRD